MKKISADKLTKAKYWRSKGMSIRDICIKTGLKKSTIHEHLKELKPVTLTKPVGSPKKLSSKLRNLVRRGFEHGCFKTSTAAKKYLINNHNLIISNQTIRNELHYIDMKSYARPLKPLLSNVQKVNRLNFAKAMIKVDTDFWEGVIFTDESKYNIFAPDGYHKVWRYSGPPTLRHHVRETVKFGGGNVMVWGAITSKGVGKLVFIDDKMDSRLFISVLSKGFKETLQMHNLSEAEVYLQQDNDPKHTSKYSKKCIEEANIEVLLWPSYSPDMNPIENLWNDLEIRLRNRSPQPTNKEDLKLALEDEWYKTSKEYINTLFKGMPRRIQALIDAKGGYIKY